jgi:hypothetical protein
MVGTKILLKTTLVSTLAGGFLLFGATSVRADARDSCQQNVQNWEYRLDRDVYRHGSNSRQANHDRHELAEARENCERRFGDNWRNHYDRDYDRDGDRR